MDLEATLQPGVRGRVDCGATAKALYATDASNYRNVPAAVITPVDEEDLVAAVAACRKADMAIVLRGAGTSIAGNATGPGVVIDTSRHLRRVHWIDAERRLAKVGPGVVLDDLNSAASEHGLMFAPDPSTHSRCTIGGMIGNNACGAHSVAFGKTADNVEALEVLLYDGARLRVGRGSITAVDAADEAIATRIGDQLRDLVSGSAELIRSAMPALPRRVSGYALDELLAERGFNLAGALVGTEGTCVTVLTATLRLVPRPAARALVVAGFDDDAAGADAVPALLSLAPHAVEGIDRELVDAYVSARHAPATYDQLPPGGGWLFVETAGDEPAQALSRAREVAAALEGLRGHRGSTVVDDPDAQSALWRIREEGAGLATRLPDGSAAYPGWEDAAVAPERLGGYLRAFRALRAEHGLRGVSYGHFGDGCVHVRVDFDFKTLEGVARFRRFVEAAADLVVDHGGSLSGEHGDGRARSELLPRMYPPEVLQLFARFKQIWDPDAKMNPGVIVGAAPLDSELRVDPRRRLIDVTTTFALSHDGGALADAVQRCVGVGKCRSERGGVMCPSYRVTGEEEHSTRGRAHLLAEMLEGEVISGGWRSTEVRDALDLCLSCKGCAGDCPVDVDVAAYKSEFLHHHYRRRLRPASHYSMGWLPLWARMASLTPAAVNALTA
ncbi:MAG: FAD-binding and (Fe-S)-binding domain-containing protein, partial [Acidimicrobiales bacterium]